MKTLPLLLTFLLAASFGQAQIMGFERIDPEKISPWIPPADYSGVYAFGDSEMSSELILLKHPEGGYFGQIRSMEWRAADSSWVQQCAHLKGVRVEGNRFFCDRTEGSFVRYDHEGDPLKALKVNTPWSPIPEAGEYEIGVRKYTLEEYVEGEYPQASLRLLRPEELKAMSKEALRLMRNEVFARYGYIFRKGGAMERHFRKQDWYWGQHTDVNHFLTELERQNIQRIRAAEQE